MVSALPTQFQFAHQYSVQLNQQLAHLLTYGQDNKAYSVSIDLPDDRHGSELSALPPKDIASWLDMHGYRTELEKLMLISLYPALLADMFVFIDEALRCSENGRLTVTYALLRKPLRDNLFYLEWLLIGPGNFAGAFYDKDPAEFSLDKMLSEDRVRPIVREAVNRTEKGTVINPDVIYDLRYKEPLGYYSFPAMWNRALHLVTTRKTHATEQRNLNLVFSDDEARITQWNHVYSFLPILLYYAVNIAEAIMLSLIGDRTPQFQVDHFHRELGFSVYSKEFIESLDTPQLSAEFPNDLDDLHVACPTCKRKIEIQQAKAKALFLDRRLKCPHCHRTHNIDLLVAHNGL